MTTVYTVPWFPALAHTAAWPEISGNGLQLGMMVAILCRRRDEPMPEDELRRAVWFVFAPGRSRDSVAHAGLVDGAMRLARELGLIIAESGTVRPSGAFLRTIPWWQETAAALPHEVDA